MSLRTAHDHLRVARALTEVPSTRAALQSGELTYSKLRALTRVATPERESELVNLATSATSEQVERVVRAMRYVDRDRDAEGEPKEVTSSRWKWNDDGSLSVSMRLAPTDGAKFLAATVRAEYERNRVEGSASVQLNAGVGMPMVPEAHRDLWRHVPADLAPAIVAMAETVRDAIEVPGVVPAAEVIVHTQVVAESVEPVVAPHLDDGPALSDVE